MQKVVGAAFAKKPGEKQAENQAAALVLEREIGLGTNETENMLIKCVELHITRIKTICLLMNIVH